MPAHYNHLLQSLIYRHIDAVLGRELHQHGVGEGHARFRFFTFSRLLGKFERQEQRLLFHGLATLHIASPNTALLESLALRLSVQGYLPIGETQVPLRRIDLVDSPPLSEHIHFRTLSPITLRAKQRSSQLSVRYLEPSDPRFSRRIIQNLRMKIRLWSGNDYEPIHAECVPVSVDPERHRHVVCFKNTWIVGWTGVYRLRAPREYLQMALDAGVGERNSAGFGCIEIIPGQVASP
jgi:CRISPR-associated endoribonuclease Cas6